MSYQPKIYRTDGGDTQVVASGGEISIESGGAIVAAGTQASNIADAKTDYTTLGLDTEAEIIDAINTSNGKINAVIAALEGVGILAAS